MFTSKKILSLIGCVTLFFTLSGVDGCNKSTTVDITIFHTNDIHSHFRAEQPGSAKNPYNLGGVARLKTLVAKMRAEKPNSLLLDAGDYSEGTGYYFIDAGSNMLKIMDEIGYDAVTVGNHDFLNGPSALASSIERANPRFPLLGANKNLSAVPDKDRVAALIKDYVIIEKAGVKIAIIGALCDDLVYYPFFKPGIVTNAIESSSKIAKKIRDEKLADVIILLSHNSLEKHATWAKQIPWINVIISGHSHQKLAKPIEVKNAGQPVYVVEAKQWAQFLGEMTLTVDKKNRQVRMKDYRLIPVSAAYKDDPKVAAMVDEADRALADKHGSAIHDHVADCEFEMNDDTKTEITLGNMITDAYRAATDSDVAVETAMLTSTVLSPGPVSTFDIMNITPYIYSPVADKPFPEFGSSWTLKRVTITGQDLRTLFSIVFLANSVGIPVGWVSTSGMTATYSKDGGANAFQDIKIFNKQTERYEPIDDETDYVMTAADGLLLSLTEITRRLHLDIDLSRREETGIQTWEAILSLVTTKQTLRAADFAAGSRFRTVEADPGFDVHNLRIEKNASGYAVHVTVQNLGLVASPAGITVRGERSNPNDSVHADTQYETWTQIGPDATLPALNPGESTTVTVPWTSFAGPGIYGMNAKLRLPAGFKDGNLLNNSARTYTTIEATRFKTHKTASR